MKLPLLLTTLLLTPTLAIAEPVTIHAVGDIMLAGSGTGTYQRRGYDYPFAATAELLQKADIVIGNLEAPLARTGEEFTGKKFRFRVDPAAGQALKNAGFTHLTLANNHILDFGAAGLAQTREALTELAIGFSGAGPDLATANAAHYSEVNGRKIAFLSYSLVYPEEFFATSSRAGTVPGYTPYFTAAIKKARESADFVIVSFHWGGEGLDTPKEYQKDAGHRAIDAGADVVLGHHPHVLQGIERYRQGVIFYSLGNFAFGSTSRKSDRSVIARIVLDEGIKEVEVIPLNVLNREVRYQPQPLQGPRAAAVAGYLDRLSRSLDTAVGETAGRFLVEPASREIATR